MIRGAVRYAGNGRTLQGPPRVNETLTLKMTPLPEFERPPVIEVAASLQFEPLDAMKSVHLGEFWPDLRSLGLTAIEDHGALEPEVEDFGAVQLSSPRITLRTFDDTLPLPRVWFLNEAKTELIQIQRDRLIVNWRQGATPEPYPRYKSVMERFKLAFDLFAKFVNARALGKIEPNQCELTYVNHLPVGQGWSKHGELGLVVTSWQEAYSDAYLSNPEDVSFRVRFRMRDGQENLGRLHIAVQSAYRTIDGQPIFVLTLTGRGKPQPPTLEGAMNLFDSEHEWIVRGFASITTPEMHHVWGRKQ